ncbi:MULTISPECIES: hypothetical protein [Moorena]|uniref:hypothetical protein n=1 Tax=Moorena TaxID=1155738 RepID=UPI00031E6632|nr:MULTISPECIES: hypothetical protein [Moorena]NEQ12830.1 hypothetical protein [Moorena sp. SIO3E2]NES86378.1 hypothetical protein [Moorena sp. SIO2B7]NEP33170.1 hypothetical protein [Moorena sp. SIO3B2]NEQ10005.1 hypothetical protein [Moorena sp. SIO4E2]NER88959.1 hypothetical protein [Moorena sp. SIO3A2]
MSVNKQRLIKLCDRVAARTEHRVAWPTANRTADLLPFTINWSHTNGAHPVRP